MGLFVRAVINGFGFSLGKFLFDVIKERITGDRPEPQRVVVENVTDFQPPSSQEPESSPN
jgi:hypothetical protein